MRQIKGHILQIAESTWIEQRLMPVEALLVPMPEHLPGWVMWWFADGARRCSGIVAVS